MTAVITVVFIKLLWLGILLLVLSFFIKAAVKSALEDKLERIKTVLQREDKTNVDDVIKLRDMEILSNDELEEAAELYQKAMEKKENHTAFLKYEKVLSELKAIGYLKEEQYLNKIEALRQRLNVE